MSARSAALPWKSVPAARPPSVQAAVAEFGSAPLPGQPQFSPDGSMFLTNGHVNALAHMGPDDAARAVRLITRELEQVEPHVLVNREVPDVLETLRGDGRFGNAFFPTKAGEALDDRPPMYLQQRKQEELRVGVHGDGPDAGRTIYGALNFGHDLREGGSYGPVGYALDGARISGRTTFTRSDSFEVMRGEVGGIEHLPTVVASNFQGPLGRPTSALHQALLEQDDEAVAALMRGALLDDDWTNGALRNGYVEAQVHGGVTLGDVAEIRLSSFMKPHEREAIHAAAERWGVPVRDLPADAARADTMSS